MLQTQTCMWQNSGLYLFFHKAKFCDVIMILPACRLPAIAWFYFIFAPPSNDTRCMPVSKRILLPRDLILQSSSACVEVRIPIAWLVAPFRCLTNQEDGFYVFEYLWRELYCVPSFANIFSQELAFLCLTIHCISLYYLQHPAAHRQISSWNTLLCCASDYTYAAMTYPYSERSFASERLCALLLSLAGTQRFATVLHHVAQ